MCAAWIRLLGFAAACVMFRVTFAQTLEFSSYGGSGGANNRTVVVDHAGIIYMSGGTSQTDWPTTFGAVHAGHGESDVTIAKFGPDGKLIWSRLLGGPSEDHAYVSAVGPKGELHVSGRAGSGFPTTSNAFDCTFNGGIGGGPHKPTDAFVAKLSPDGNLLYSTYIGGNGDENGRTINHAAKVLRAGDTVLVKEGTYDVGASPNWAAPAVAYLDYNVYDAPPMYDFGEYTSNRQRLSFDQMQAAGFEEHSRVVSSVRDVFEDEVSYRLLPAWKTAGRQTEPPGPEDTASVLDVRRYGPSAVRP